MLRAIPIINWINVSQTCVSRYPASDCWYNMIGNLFFRQPATSHKHPPIKLTHLSDEGLAQGGGGWRTSSPPLLLLLIEWLLTRSFAVHIIHRWVGRSVGGWVVDDNIIVILLPPSRTKERGTEHFGKLISYFCLALLPARGKWENTLKLYLSSPLCCVGGQTGI